MTHAVAYTWALGPSIWIQDHVPWKKVLSTFFNGKCFATLPIIVCIQTVAFKHSSDFVCISHPVLSVSQ